MKKLLRVLLCVFGVCSTLAAAVPPIEFAGVTYHLAFSHVGKDGATVNEYVPAGERIENWTTLLAVRHWPNQASLRTVVGGWLKMVEPLLAKNPVSFPANDPNNPRDQIVEAWLGAPDRSYLEINLYRFLQEPGTAGIKAYQFAQKIKAGAGKPDPQPFLDTREARFAALAKLSLPAYKTSEALQAEIATLDLEIAELRKDYKDRYPPLRAKLRAIEELKQQLEVVGAKPPSASP